MKVTTLMNVKHKGKVFKAGSKLDVTNAIAKELLAIGAIEPLGGGAEDDRDDNDGSDGETADLK
ncbi:hypothetical protein [Exiguobacterium sp. S22-S28]|uniref:DUF7210 family protein n=1 Tax=Exiguobacterium sp. S22-S28 TaxID=3342768 RepID=UPI00372D71C7